MTSPLADRPFTGQQVALLGKLSVLSKRDTRALVERLGGVFAPDVRPGTTIIVTGTELLLSLIHI